MYASLYDIPILGTQGEGHIALENTYSWFENYGITCFLPPFVHCHSSLACYNYRMHALGCRPAIILDLLATLIQN